MTTIVYHDNVLAADRRTKYFNSGVGTIKQTHCSVCNTQTEAITVNDNKVVLITSGIALENDKVLAVAGAGGGIPIGKLIKLMQRGYGPDLIIDLADGMASDWLDSFDMLFVCENSVRVLDYWGGNVNWKVYTRDQTVSLGQGHPAALLAIRHLGKDAVDAVKLAAIGDDCTGNGAVYVDFNHKPLEVVIDHNTHCN
jgi:hypothetical protein